MAGGAAEAMFPGDDAPANQRRWIEVADVLRCSMVGRRGQGIIEVTIVQRPVPAHVDLPATHQPTEGFGIERLA